MMTMTKTLLHRWFFTVAILLHAATTTTTTNTGGAFADAASSSVVQRITLPETSSALCLDGNPAGFFLEKAAGESKDRDKFVVFLQGGGLCRSQADCVARSRTALGSFRRNTWRVRC
ncbi:pectin acetylesterase [Pycnococcus provasolii]